jgi:hypothetical protein
MSKIDTYLRYMYDMAHEPTLRSGILVDSSVANRPIVLGVWVVFSAKPTDQASFSSH